MESEREMTGYEEVCAKQVEAIRRKKRYFQDCERYTLELFKSFTEATGWKQPILFSSFDDESNPDPSPEGKLELIDVGGNKLGLLVRLNWEGGGITGEYTVHRDERGELKADFLGVPVSDDPRKLHSFQMWIDELQRRISENYLS
jgi:hypothetical protein